jgi:hypothetical protein
MVDKKLFNSLFDSIVGDKVQFIIAYNKDDVSEYVRDFFREEVYNWISHQDRISRYSSQKGKLNAYLTTLIRNYMGLKKQQMNKNPDYKKLVLKKYYRDKNLKLLLSE